MALYIKKCDAFGNKNIPLDQRKKHPSICFMIDFSTFLASNYSFYGSTNLHALI